MILNMKNHFILKYGGYFEICLLMKCKDGEEFDIHCKTERSVGLYFGSIDWSKYFGSLAVLGLYIYEIMCTRRG